MVVQLPSRKSFVSAPLTHGLSAAAGDAKQSLRPHGWSTIVNSYWTHLPEIQHLTPKPWIYAVKYARQLLVEAVEFDPSLPENLLTGPRSSEK